MHRSLIMMLVPLLLAATARAQSASPEGPVAVVKEFWQRALDDDLKGAMRFFMWDDPDRYVSVGAKSEPIRQKAIAIKGAWSEKIDQDIAAVSVEGVDRDGAEHAFSFYLIRRTATGEWKIVDFFQKTAPIPPRSPAPRRDFIRKNGAFCPKCG